MGLSDLNASAIISASESNLYSEDFSIKWLQSIIEIGKVSTDELVNVLISLTRFQLCRVHHLYHTTKFLDRPIPDLLEIIDEIVVANCYDERGALFPDAVITEWTWDLINRANHSSEELSRFLINMTPDDFERFYDETTRAGYVFNDDLFTPYMEYESEDGIHDLGLFIVGQGKDFYYDVWQNPQKISLLEQETSLMENVVISAKSRYYRHLWELEKS